MEFPSENRERIAAAVQVDRLFDAYEIELTPIEAFWFTQSAPPASVPTDAKLFSLIERINDAIPAADFGSKHPQTGKSHHHYRMGRDRGHRLLKIELFKGFFQVDYDFMALMEMIHSLGVRAGAQVVIAAGNNSYSIEMRWGGKIS